MDDRKKYIYYKYYINLIVNVCLIFGNVLYLVERMIFKM